jgi:hypothetical protein
MSELVISQDLIKQMIDQTVENLVVDAVKEMTQDPLWLEKIERTVQQAMV